MTLFDMSGKVAVITGSSRGIGRAIAERMAEPGLKGSTVLGAYAISKAADMQLARNLACEYGKHNIRVNCIAPGLIKTDFARALWENPETLKASTARSPLARIGDPDEIAGAAVFLGSAAGTFTTGQTIVIDGGATIS